MRVLAEAIIPQLQPPFAFWGHSMGAMISFELARELRRKANPFLWHCLFRAECATQTPDPDPITFNLPEKDFIAELQRLNGTPKEVLDNPELKHLFLPILRADFEVVETYVYELDVPLACAIHAYGGLKDSHVPVNNLKAWQEQTSRECVVRMFPGDHFFIHTCSADVLNVLRRKLSQLSAGKRAG